MKYFLIIIPLFFLSACSSPQKLLMRTWKISDVVFLDSLNTFTPQQKQTLTNSLKAQVQFSFLPDSVYRVVSNSDTINGKWWISADKKTLTTVSPQGTIPSKITELKKKNFTFESVGGMNQTFRFICIPVVTDKK